MCICAAEAQLFPLCLHPPGVSSLPCAHAPGPSKCSACIRTGATCHQDRYCLHQLCLACLHQDQVRCSACMHKDQGSALRCMHAPGPSKCDAQQARCTSFAASGSSGRQDARAAHPVCTRLLSLPFGSSSHFHALCARGGWSLRCRRQQRLAGSGAAHCTWGGRGAPDALHGRVLLGLHHPLLRHRWGQGRVAQAAGSIEVAAACTLVLGCTICFCVTSQGGVEAVSDSSGSMSMGNCPPAPAGLCTICFS